MYSIHQLTKESYNQIIFLLKKTFKISKSIKNISDKYDTEIFGKSTIGFIAKDEFNSPAAYYGVFPVVLDYFGKDYLVAQSGETMTSPEHQKKGLFTRLAKETYKKSKEEGIELVFGFPNENSAPGFTKKLDWVFNGYMQKFSIKINTLPLCEIATKLSFLRGGYRLFVKTRIKKYTLKLNSINISNFSFNANAYVKKDLRYFEYKLRNKDNFLVKINNFKMLIKVESHLKIGVVEFFEKSEFNSFITTVIKLAKKLGCGKVIFLMSSNYWLFDYLKDEYKVNESLPIGFYQINQDIDYTLIQFTQADYDTF